MFFIFGWGKQLRKNFGAVLNFKCSHCNNESPWNLFRISTWFSLFFIPVIPYSVEKYILCPVCQYGIKLNNEQFEKFKSIAEINNSLASGSISQARYDEEIKLLLGNESKTQETTQEEVTNEEAPVITDGLKYCSECGNKISAESKFCKFCGNKII